MASFSKKGIKDRYKMTIMQAIGLSVILIGIRSALNATDLLGIIICMVVGSLLGEAMRIEDQHRSAGVPMPKNISAGRPMGVFQRDW